MEIFGRVRETVILKVLLLNQSFDNAVTEFTLRLKKVLAALGPD